MMAECYDCKLDYTSAAWVDVVVPDAYWRLISPTRDENGLLCFSCMNARLLRLGLRNVPYYIASGAFSFDLRTKAATETT